MVLSNWLSFAVFSLTFFLIPGPSVCFTIAYALKCGTRRTLMSIAGQLAANAVHILAVSVGLRHLLAASAGILTMLKLLGAAYIVYLGITQWCAKSPEAQQTGRAGATVSSAWNGFARGFVVCGTNPKALLYYAAILPPFISPAHNAGIQLVVLGLTSVTLGGFVLLGYAMVAAKVRAWLISEDRSQLLNRVAGVVMIAAGAYLAVTPRS